MSKKISILIVDDDKKGAFLLQKGIELSSDFQTECVHSGEDAVKMSLKNNYDAVLMDLNLPNMDGIEALCKIHIERPFCPIIIITGHNEIQSAVTAIKKGAFDYLIKPLDLDHVVAIIKRALEQNNLKQKNEAQKVKVKTNQDDRIIYKEDSILKSVIDMAEKIAISDASVLINGESGTGKELFAKLIHTKSLRVNQPFIEVNCGAIPEELIESELFGHEKGAFTGAYDKREGLFSLANKGTIFLDEIGELPLTMQVKLLRTLQSGEVRKIGSNLIAHVDVRVIAATAKNLEKEVSQGNFREDLFYRLNVINLVVPPLRKRKGDIPLLVDYFIHNIHIGGKNITSIEKDALDLIKKHNWPGNIRELKNAIERLMLLCEDNIIKAEDVEKDFLIKVSPRQKLVTEELSLADLEATHIKKILNFCNGNKTHAAKKLGITIQTLYNKLNKLGIDD